MPTVEAWARWTVPNASSTNSSPRWASWLANPGSFASSPGWNRRFSSIRNSLFARRTDISIAFTPTASSASGTGCPSIALRRCTTGRSEKRGSRWPPGRPRWVRMMVRAPAARRWFSVGIASTIRRLSATPPRASSGTLKSTRTSTRRPLRGADEIPRFGFIARVARDRALSRFWPRGAGTDRDAGRSGVGQV